MDETLTRRALLKSFLAGLALIGSGCLTRKARAQPAVPTELVSENDPLARSLRYFPDAASAPPSLRERKLGTEGKDQFCRNCVQFKTTGLKDGAEVGTCRLISSGLVKANAWCSSWAKKPG